jgi:hypothetical protein
VQALKGFIYNDRARDLLSHLGAAGGDEYDRDLASPRRWPRWAQSQNSNRKDPRAVEGEAPAQEQSDYPAVEQAAGAVTGWFVCNFRLISLPGGG